MKSSRLRRLSWSFVRDCTVPSKSWRRGWSCRSPFGSPPEVKGRGVSSWYCPMRQLSISRTDPSASQKEDPLAKVQAASRPDVDRGDDSCERHVAGVVDPGAEA